MKSTVNEASITCSLCAAHDETDELVPGEIRNDRKQGIAYVLNMIIE